MRTFTEYVNESYIIEGFTPEMKQVFSKAQLANAGRALYKNHGFNLEKTNFKEVDTSVITKNAKSLDKKVVLIKTSDSAYLITYNANTERPILVIDLDKMSKEYIYSTFVKAVSAQINRKSIADSAERVFISTDEVFDRLEINKERRDNKPSNPNDYQLKNQLKDRLANYKAGKVSKDILLDSNKSYEENINMMEERVRKSIANRISKASYASMQIMNWEEFITLLRVTYSYISNLHKIEANKVTDALLKETKKYFDYIVARTSD